MNFGWRSIGNGNMIGKKLSERYLLKIIDTGQISNGEVTGKRY
jgi:hypothetical protein